MLGMRAVQALNCSAADGVDDVLGGSGRLPARLLVVALPSSSASAES